MNGVELRLASYIIIRIKWPWIIFDEMRGGGRWDGRQRGENATHWSTWNTGWSWTRDCWLGYTTPEHFLLYISTHCVYCSKINSCLLLYNWVEFNTIENPTNPSWALTSEALGGRPSASAGEWKEGEKEQAWGKTRAGWVLFTAKPQIL